MDIHSEEQMAERLNFMRPLKPAPEEKQSIWCIPFEYGPSEPGTKISISKAKEIAADLRAHIAEAEKKELKKYFDRETARSEDLCKQLSEEMHAKHAAQAEVEILKSKLRRRGKR